MEKYSAGEALNKAIDISNTNLTKEDKEVLKGLSNMLGKVDIDGQISEIKLVDSFLNVQLENAEEEYRKNNKMYKTLGIIVGIMIVIVLI